MDNNLIRLILFACILLLCIALESIYPRRVLTQPKWYRWVNNIALVVFNSLLLRLTLPLLAFEAAAWTEQHSVGLLHLLGVSSLINIIISVLVLDLLIYWQHRLFHVVPWLWALHKMHHSDQDIDVTTGARFHPIEIWLSMIIKITAVLILGISPIAVIIFEVALNGCAMFNHSNLRLSQQLDKIIRKCMVTPDMHRVHHSIIRRETNSNYGFCLSIWDRLFNSYIAQPKHGHGKMRIGIAQFRHPNEQRLDKLLTQPFRKH
ncbi:sterol desaturase family protein [Vibrio gallicus]|uniref:sterol desaturase family protein n=1 Tax=Vibrio gallicus TaxID=190897 RepID=UPI0021C36646|nr:sterol desaturase family protein [Vibrio gallicus]